MVSICPLLWQRDVKLQQTKPKEASCQKKRKSYRGVSEISPSPLKVDAADADDDRRVGIWKDPLPRGTAELKHISTAIYIFKCIHTNITDSTSEIIDKSYMRFCLLLVNIYTTMVHTNIHWHVDNNIHWIMFWAFAVSSQFWYKQNLNFFLENDLFIVKIIQITNRFYWKHMRSFAVVQR